MKDVQERDKKTEIKNKILAFFARKQVTGSDRLVRGSGYAGYWINDDEVPAYRYDDISDEVQRPVATLKILMNEMKRDGLVELVMTIDSINFAPCGSGWFITEKGLKYIVDNGLIEL